MALGRKNKTAFFCSQCGAEHPRWQGQCRECNQWNCLIEENVPARRSETTRAASAEKKTIPEIEPIGRSGFRSGINEFDRVLGGQLLPGTAVLLGGEPGIGKSTLLLQLAEAYSRENLPVLYVTGEESLPQIKQRAERLQIVGTKVTVVNTTSLEEIIELVGKNDFRVVLVDSIQTVASSQFDSPPGTVAQVRESAGRLISLAKANDIALFLVGHITKDGMVAGPKVLEHMVDTVVYFEGDRTHLYRMLRPTKNRYGPITEVGIFEMMPQGLVEVANPSSLFLADHGGKARSGSVVTSICEGSRPILVEIQALETAANYGNPQRVAGGTDNKRLALLLAILEKRGGYPMSQNDVFVSIAGGLKISEPAVDLPLMAAIVSSQTNRTVSRRTLVVGEAGLSGEVRGIAMIDRRIAEASRMGYERIIVPQANCSQVGKVEIEVVGATDIESALQAALE